LTPTLAERVGDGPDDPLHNRRIDFRNRCEMLEANLLRRTEATRAAALEIALLVPTMTAKPGALPVSRAFFIVLSSQMVEKSRGGSANKTGQTATPSDLAQAARLETRTVSSRGGGLCCQAHFLDPSQRKRGKLGWLNAGWPTTPLLGCGQAGV
jgi:hypothetical protein